MRVNVYGEELTREVQIVRKGNFSGVRFILESPQTLHFLPDDDDRSAVTFWGLIKTREILERALDEINKILAQSASSPTH